MTLQQCILECALNREFVAQFDRLTNSNLSGVGTPLDLMIDEATGRLADDAAKFILFVDECVWQRLGLMEGNK